MTTAEPLQDGPRLTGLRRRVRSGEPVTGTFVSINAPAVVEMLGLAGFDTLCLDAEHAAYDLRDLEDMLRAAELHGVDALVRVPEVGVTISRVLDAGARGVLVPRVESAEEAARAVSLARYPAEGERGAGPGRASGYGAHIGRTIAGANGAVAVIAQVETRAGLEHAAEIAATPGLDAVFVGPGDLAVSLGVAPGSPDHQEAVGRAIASARDAGQVTGIFVTDPAEIPAYRALGVTLFLVQSDSMFLLSRATEIHRAARLRSAEELPDAGARRIGVTV